MVIVEPPTSEKMEEKCGTERATNKTAPITVVRVKIRFHVNPEMQQRSTRLCTGGAALKKAELHAVFFGCGD
ncbi:hypothetical protein DPMN_160557 [Dreissena polymorpha]|uniref:Uncharacterized protein n=1 Tax=Dreissena polymorpha TaxID=45954 RepID=A0A9D4ENP8_DREPO|nr:hypothetical protein DPMN_160557 [Dreissena polymorpha]